MRGFQVQRTGFRLHSRPIPSAAPRRRVGQHLKWIRSLPCAVCGCSRGIQAAHIRAASLQFGKVAIGLAEKPDGCWTTSLCGQHHVFGAEAVANGYRNRLIQGAHE